MKISLSVWAILTRKLCKGDPKTSWKIYLFISVVFVSPIRWFGVRVCVCACMWGEERIEFASRSSVRHAKSKNTLKNIINFHKVSGKVSQFGGMVPIEFVVSFHSVSHVCAYMSRQRCCRGCRCCWFIFIIFFVSSTFHTVFSRVCTRVDFVHVNEVSGRKKEKEKEQRQIDKMSSATTIDFQIASAANLEKIERFMNASAYQQNLEYSANFNTRLCVERRLRLPFFDPQTGVAQNHCSLFMTRRQRMPGFREGKLYSYPGRHPLLSIILRVWQCIFAMRQVSA